MNYFEILALPSIDKYSDAGTRPTAHRDLSRARVPCWVFAGWRGRVVAQPHPTAHSRPRSAPACTIPTKLEIVEEYPKPTSHSNFQTPCGRYFKRTIAWFRVRLDSAINPTKPSRVPNQRRCFTVCDCRQHSPFVVIAPPNTTHTHTLTSPSTHSSRTFAFI